MSRLKKLWLCFFYFCQLSFQICLQACGRGRARDVCRPRGQTGRACSWGILLQLLSPSPHCTPRPTYCTTPHRAKLGACVSNGALRACSKEKMAAA